MVHTEHGKEREELEERTWNVSRLKGIPLFIRIRDNERGAWGHINVRGYSVRVGCLIGIIQALRPRPLPRAETFWQSAETF